MSKLNRDRITLWPLGIHAQTDQPELYWTHPRAWERYKDREIVAFVERGTDYGALVSANGGHYLLTPYGTSLALAPAKVRAALDALRRGKYGITRAQRLDDAGLTEADLAAADRDMLAHEDGREQ